MTVPVSRPAMLACQAAWADQYSACPDCDHAQWLHLHGKCGAMHCVCRREFTPDSHTTGPVVPVFQERDGRARGGEA